MPQTTTTRSPISTWTQCTITKGQIPMQFRAPNPPAAHHQRTPWTPWAADRNQQYMPPAELQLRLEARLPQVCKATVHNVNPRGTGRKNGNISKTISMWSTVEPRFNELLGITNNSFRPGKSYGKCMEQNLDLTNLYQTNSSIYWTDFSSPNLKFISI